MRNGHEHLVSMLVHNKPGVMRKVANLFARRGFNISSITVGESETPGLSRLVIMVKGDDRTIEQIEKQAYKLVEVVKVTPIDPLPENRVEREMALIKVKFEGDKQELFQLVEIFRGKIIDVSREGAIIEITGSRSKVEAFIDLLPEKQVEEIARTGIVAMNRWNVKEKEGF
ncbi:acetolactate synthase small subunit [Thermotoga sp. KOL6]|uniref:acetolactate synthase small subunit n=1 Tax=Thermotoga sp. KOL6 TaxID=126741 RepID=UPI000C7955A3|nr:acetolactate synthase small subunit [Thermotoga sp. KOL6]PLV59267.1 acetolactate synthase small subunit [Thermotoga sp. KOL6]